MRYVVVTLTLITAGLLLGGCNEEQKTLTANDVRMQMVNDLHTMTMDHEEYDNRAAHTMTVNWRNISDDVHRLLLLDRPQRAFNSPQTQN